MSISVGQAKLSVFVLTCWDVAVRADAMIELTSCATKIVQHAPLSEPALFNEALHIAPADVNVTLYVMF